jgi:hypothetical protein
MVQQYSTCCGCYTHTCTQTHTHTAVVQLGKTRDRGAGHTFFYLRCLLDSLAQHAASDPRCGVFSLLLGLAPHPLRPSLCHLLLDMALSLLHTIHGKVWCPWLLAPCRATIRSGVHVHIPVRLHSNLQTRMRGSARAYVHN